MSIEILILCSERHFEMLSPVVKWRGEHCDVRYMLSVAHYDAHRFFLMSFFRCCSSDVCCSIAVVLEVACIKMADCLCATGHNLYMLQKLFCSGLDALHVSEHEYACDNADNDEYYPDSPKRHSHPEKTWN